MTEAEAQERVAKFTTAVARLLTGTPARRAMPAAISAPRGAQPPGLRFLWLNLPPGPSGGDGQPAEPMAAQARWWAEAAEPLAARASGRGGGARGGPPDPSGPPLSADSAGRVRSSQIQP